MTTSKHNNYRHPNNNQTYNDHHNYAVAAVTVTSSSSSSSSSRQRVGQQQQKQANKKLTISIEEEIDRYAQQLIEYTARTHYQRSNHNNHDGTTTIDDTDRHQSLSQLHCNIDDSLGSYITNCLRTELSEMNHVDFAATTGSSNNTMIDISTITDYESFCELILEHCQMELDCESNHLIAISVLQKILTVLLTQEIPTDDLLLFQTRCMEHNVINDNEVSPQHDFNNNDLLLPDSLWKDVLGDHDDDTTNDTADDAVVAGLQLNVPTNGMIVSPDQVEPDVTIDSNSKMTPTRNDGDDNTTGSHLHQPLLIEPQVPHERQFELDNGEVQGQQLPVHEEQQYEVAQSHRHHQHHHDVDEYIRANIVNMLMQMYVQHDLSHEAAYAATVLAESNMLLAQYIIAAAFTQMPICKHLMNTGKCYRADCTFNHNIEHHTCVFWMKSRGCSKPVTDPCRFLHGFSRKTLENIPDQIRQQIQLRSNYNSNSTITPYQNVRDFYATKPQNNNNNNNDNNYYSNNDIVTTTTHDMKSNSVWASKNSFANIAAQGFDTQQSFVETKSSSYNNNTDDTTTLSIEQQMQQIRTMLIPQHLWLAHEHRDASAFFITDPLERYYAVSSKSQKSNNVIDLHYQSIKTFPTVLDVILPNKLLALSSSAIHPNDDNDVHGIWIITGTGHSVNTHRTHQKSGGTLESVVLEYLLSNYSNTARMNTTTTTTNTYDNIRIYKGRDRNGKGGAIYIQQQNI